MNNHQYLNAMQFKKNNECLVFNEERLKIKLLSKKIENLIFLEKKNRLYNKKIKIQKLP